MMHIIDRLRIEVRCPEEGQAFRLRQAFSRTFQPDIVKIIDEVCSEYSTEEELLRIDTLEIDLGRLTPYSLEQNFAARFREQFTKELAKKRNARTLEEHKAAKEYSSMDLFCNFMLHGTLPWWSNEAEVDIDAIIGELYHRWPEQLHAFFNEQRENQPLWIRAAFQLNDRSKRLIISLFSSLKDAETQLLRLIASGKTDDVHFIEPAGFLDAVRGALLRHAPEFIHNQDVAARMTSLFDTVVKEMFPDLIGGLTDRYRAELITIREVATTDAPVFDTVIKETSPDLIKSFTKIPGMISSDVTTASVMAQTLAKKAGLTHTIDTGFRSPESETEDSSEQRYVVRHSGIILLAPFFKKFFDACGLLDGSNWKHKEAQYQAAHLLRYLSTGSKTTPEYSLVLEKLCCGIAIEEPVPLDTGFLEYQLNEALALLASVIEHWKVLKNTSVDGLRETFLKRDGLVTRKNDAWLLQVERKTLDVLLESIPWGYSTVALPWNDTFIHVEW